MNDPLILPAADADYLEPDDRVLGVSINGEHRAYPLRILNLHEMANDVLAECLSPWPIEPSAVLESCIPLKSGERS